MITSYIGLGSNLEQPLQQAIAARHALERLTSLKVSAYSSLYQSKPMGPQDQPDYLNAVLAIDSELSAEALLDALQTIEQEQGRSRKAERWGPRTLDLDLLLYGENTINSQRLTVPHYGIKQREFVLLPLAEIAPNLSLPDGSAIVTLAQHIKRNGLERFKAPEDWA